MLAVDVITNKLRDQSLDETKNAGNSKIKFIHPGEGLKLSKNAEATLAGSGASLTGSGKKMLTFQLRSPGDIQALLCPHGQISHLCADCENTHNTPPTPPKKRHCRNLSAPGDGQEPSSWQPQGIVPIDGPAPSSWQPKGTEIWKPVTIQGNEMWKPVTVQTGSGSKTIFKKITTTPRTSAYSLGFESLAPKLGQFDTGGFISPSDLVTPPESPVPRPSSASTCSGRYDGAFSPLGAPWLEHNLQGYNKYSAFQNRSLSVEDEISYSMSAGSTTSVPGCISSVPSSPHRPRIPRCKSQPTFIRERKCGVKRRRDYDRRPTLDFHKMTETAYELRPVASSHRTKERTASRFHQELESVMSLMPIASSPMDNDYPIKRMMDSRASPINEIDSARSESTEFLDGECLDNDESVKVNEQDSDNGESSDVEEGIFTLQEDLDLEQIENH